MNLIVRKRGYYTSSADLLLLFIIFDLSSIIFSSEISLIIRKQEFRDELNTILVALSVFTLVIWLLIVIRIESSFTQAIFKAVKNVRKTTSSFDQLHINWPLWSLFWAWFFSGVVTVFHLGLLFIP